MIFCIVKYILCILIQIIFCFFIKGQNIIIKIDTVSHFNEIIINGKLLFKNDYFENKNIETILGLNYRIQKRKYRHRTRTFCSRGEEPGPETFIDKTFRNIFYSRTVRKFNLIYDSLGLYFMGSDKNELYHFYISFEPRTINQGDEEILQTPAHQFKGNLYINGIQINNEDRILDSNFIEHLYVLEASIFGDKTDVIPASDSFCNIPLYCTVIPESDYEVISCSNAENYFSLSVDRKNGKIKTMNISSLGLKK